MMNSGHPEMHIKVETQMRAGTHYLLDALIQVYGAKVAKIKGTKFEFVQRSIINKGLYDTSESDYPSDSSESIIFHYHYFHDLPFDERLINSKTICLVGFPFDSFYSDGLVFSSKKYSVSPSATNDRYQRYRLLFKSNEWNFLESYMRKNAEWLDKIPRIKDGIVIRYEDFIRDFRNTLVKIENYAGPFRQPFPKPKVDQTRTYWTNDYKRKMDRKAFDYLKDLFNNSLRYFYPEKFPIRYSG